MAKVKLNLPTSVVEEKTLITCFEESGNKYVIFDADSVGSMGLPIILVSKINEDRVVKITDQNEWNSVKTYLKEIIQGIGKKYVAVADSMAADEAYFTQLTLPVASFETIKKAYVPESAPTESAAPVETMETSTEDVSVPAPTDVVAENPIVDVSPIVSETVAPVENSASSETAPVVDNASVVEPSPLSDVVPVDSTSASDNNPLNGETSVVAENIPAAPVVDVVEPNTQSDAPIIDSVVPAIETPSNVETSPIIDSNEPAQSTPVEEKNEDVPALDLGTPVINEQIDSTPKNVVTEVVTPEPAVVQENIVSSNEANSNVYKEAFLKACGEMFDSLVNAINNK